MATASKSKKKVPGTIGGKNKPAGTSAAQKQPAPTASTKPGASKNSAGSGKPGTVADPAAKDKNTKRKKKS